jgi:hypothetical protein
MLIALFGVFALLQTIFTQCDPVVEPYKTLKDSLGFTIAFNSTGRVPCYEDTFNGSAGTCCSHDELKAGIQKITLQTKQQWQAYADAMDAFFEKTDSKINEFFNNFDLTIKTFNGVPYSIWKYLPIELANRDQWEYLRDIFLDTKAKRTEYKKSLQECYNFTVNLKAWAMCELCKSYSFNYVSINSSVLHGKQVNVYATSCLESMNPCGSIFQFNYRLVSAINLYLTFSHLRFGTSIPAIDPALYYDPEQAPALIDSLINCKDIRQDSCTDARKIVICDQLAGFFNTNPFGEGSLTAMNNLVSFLNTSDKVGVVPVQSALPALDVIFIDNISTTLTLMKADYRLLATSDTDPMFKDIKIDNITTNTESRSRLYACVCMLAVNAVNLLAN